MEAIINDIPGIAVSLDSPENHLGILDYGPAARAAQKVTAHLIRDGFPAHTVVNMNVPYLPDEDIRGMKITRLGLRLYRDLLDRRQDPRGTPYYWIGGEAPTGIAEAGTDYGTVKAGYISITPLQLDMTAYKVMEDLKGLQRDGK
jgi:5'-nucleotidase